MRCLLFYNKSLPNKENFALSFFGITYLFIEFYSSNLKQKREHER